MANNSLKIPIRICSMVTHFHLPTCEYHWTSRQARDIAISATSLGTWFFSKEYLCGQNITSFRNYPVQNRGERGLLPTCGWPLLTVDSEVNGDSKSTNERGPSLVCSPCRYMRLLYCLGCSGQPSTKYFFPCHSIFQFMYLHPPET